MCDLFKMPYRVNLDKGQLVFLGIHLIVMFISLSFCKTTTDEPTSFVLHDKDSYLMFDSWTSGSASLRTCNVSRGNILYYVLQLTQDKFFLISFSFIIHCLFSSFTTKWVAAFFNSLSQLFPCSPNCHL